MCPSGDYEFGAKAILEVYMWETHGLAVGTDNGYAIGKRWLNITVSAWREDIRAGLLWPEELYADTRFPAWWLKGVIK